MTIAMVVIAPVRTIAVPAAVAFVATSIMTIVAPEMVMTVTPWQRPFWRNLNRNVTSSFLGHVIEQSGYQVSGVMGLQKLGRGVLVTISGVLGDQFIDIVEGRGYLAAEGFLSRWWLQWQHPDPGQLLDFVKVVHFIWRHEGQ